MTQSRSGLIQFARLPFRSATVEKLFRSLTNHRLADSYIARIPPKHIDYPKPSWRTVNVNGVKLRLDISDLVGWYAYWGFSDAPRTRLYSLMNNGDCIFDVGANLGEVSANAAKLVGPHGRVIAFEPYPANFDLLAKNVELNGFENLMIVNKGVGSENGKLKMVVADESNAGMNRISDNPVSDEGNTTEVEVVRLDDFVDQIGLEDIDLIKIDVEGFEMNVLRGAETVLSTLRPKLFLEVIDNYLRLQGSSANEVLQFLESLHYELTYAASGNPVDSRDNFSDTQFDVVALPKKVRETP